MRFWSTIDKCGQIVKDPQSNLSRRMTENLTAEEMDGVMDMERISRIFAMERPKLEKELEHLTKRLQD